MYKIPFLLQTKRNVFGKGETTVKLWWLLAVALTMLVAVPSVDAAEDTYTVKRGDTLWKISVRYEIGLSEIINANPQFDNPDLIYPGQMLRIPKL